RVTFQPANARGLRGSYELRVGDAVVHARIADGRLEVAPGAFPDADLTIEAGPVLHGLFTGETTPAAAVQSGAVRLRGKKGLFPPFVACFRTGPPPAACHRRPTGTGRHPDPLPRAAAPPPPPRAGRRGRGRAPPRQARPQRRRPDHGAGGGRPVC